MKIFLIGMMGSGKNYWMNKLSGKLKLQKYDLDHLIEGVEDRSIQQIFNESGEEHFRKMESIVLKWFSDRDDFILATGGGTPCFFDNIDWMNAQGLTIWLDEPIDTLLKRLTPEKTHRPLISKMSDKKMKTFLQEKRAERDPYYNKAKHILRGETINEQHLLSIIKDYKHA
jgi:shikimate kinase